AHDDGDVELAHEALEVERLDGLRHVLRGDDRALDDEKVELGIDDVLGERLRALRRHRRARHDAGGPDLADALTDELGLDGLAVDLLHAARGLVGGQLGDLVEERLRILVTGPQALEVEHADTAELADLDGSGGAHDTVHGGGHERALEPEGVDLPADVAVLRIARATARHDGDVVEPVGPSTRLADADLDLSHLLSSVPVSAPVKESSLLVGSRRRWFPRAGFAPSERGPEGPHDPEHEEQDREHDEHLAVETDDAQREEQQPDPEPEEEPCEGGEDGSTVCAHLSPSGRRRRWDGPW